MTARNWLRAHEDNPDSPQYELDHAHWSPFTGEQFFGAGLAQSEVSEQASAVTGAHFGLPMDDLEFQETVVEGESYQDEEGSWLR